MKKYLVRSELEYIQQTLTANNIFRTKKIVAGYLKLEKCPLIIDSPPVLTDSIEVLSGLMMDVNKCLIYKVHLVSKETLKLFAYWVIFYAFLSSADFFSKSTFSKNSLRNIIRVSNS